MQPAHVKTRSSFNFFAPDKPNWPAKIILTVSVESIKSQLALESAARIRDQIPPGGFFAGLEWKISPMPFPLGENLAKEIESLGRVLLQFYRATNLLYRKSVEGKQPEWVARWLDLGKPADLIALQRSPAFKNDVPRVIRPDILLTENGFSITELDSVPGGIGLTGWLNQTYSKPESGNLKPEILGGADGMIRGFESIFGGARQVHIIVSEEAKTYRPEMEWLAARLKERRVDLRVIAAENYEPQNGRAVYRFFELFDLPNIPKIDNLLRANAEGRLTITPPIKPFLEEKMWFALFWLKPLHEFWRRELGEKYFLQLQEVIPYSWMLDPTPLPQHAVIPRLEIHDWREAAKLSQKERDLLLKVSGFSPLGWGSRGISLGSDLAHAEWEKRIENALVTFDSSPTIMQRFHKGRLVEHRYWDPDSSELKAMKGRVRLCPYYFVEQDKVKLRGALATIVPADKKFLHGMRDAILIPSRTES